MKVIRLVLKTLKWEKYTKKSFLFLSMKDLVALSLNSSKKSNSKYWERVFSKSVLVSCISLTAKIRTG